MSLFAKLSLVSLVALALGGCATTGIAPGDHLGFAGTPSPLSADHASRTTGDEARPREVATTSREPSRVRYPGPVTREVTCRQCSR